VDTILQMFKMAPNSSVSKQMRTINLLGYSKFTLTTYISFAIVPPLISGDLPTGQWEGAGPVFLEPKKFADPIPCSSVQLSLSIPAPGIERSLWQITRNTSH
jgi:hypothetical protein